MILHFYSDPGHGWLKISSTILTQIGCNPSDFSEYSYIKEIDHGKQYNIYLEEDYDAPKFLKILSDKKIEFNIISHFNNKKSKIRTYNKNYVSSFI